MTGLRLYTVRFDPKLPEPCVISEPVLHEFERQYRIPSSHVREQDTGDPSVFGRHPYINKGKFPLDAKTALELFYWDLKDATDAMEAKIKELQQTVEANVKAVWWADKALDAMEVQE